MEYLEGDDIKINSVKPIQNYLEQIISLDQGAKVGPQLTKFLKSQMDKFGDLSELSPINLIQMNGILNKENSSR